MGNIIINSHKKCKKLQKTGEFTMKIKNLNINNKHTKKEGLKTILISIFFILMATNLNALMALNGICRFHFDSCDKNDPATVGGSVVNGAESFFKSNSAFQMFLSEMEKTEKSEPNFQAMKSWVNLAIDHIKDANNSYSTALGISKNYPYDTNKLEALKTFNFTDFENAYELNSQIFSQVKAILVTGNIKAIFERCKNNTNQILSELSIMKTVIDSNTLPTTELSWKINQLYFDMEMFGQYVSMVIKNLP